MQRKITQTIKSALCAATLTAFLTLPAIVTTAHAEAVQKQQELLPPMITVNGTAERQVNPDYAILSLGLTTQGATVNAAKQKNDVAMSAILSRLQSLGIAKADTKTSHFSVSPDYTYNNTTNENKITGYTINNTVSVKINDFNKVSSVIDGAAAAGANTINSLNFYNENEQSLDDQLTREAIQNARHKADVIASALNTDILSVRSVSGGDYNRQYDYVGEMKLNRALSTSTPVESGSITVRKQVSIVYSLR